jgi:sodium/potassium-transporting ATPase subunit alpha
MVIELAWIWMLLYVEPVQNICITATVPLKDLWILLPFPILLFFSHEFYKWRKRLALSSKLSKNYSVD